MTRNIKVFLILISCVALVSLCFIFSRPTEKEPSPVIITEVCADNSHAAYDDNANYGADYIELYNRSDAPINLKGWALSDDATALWKFVFPDFTIEPGQAVIAWCSPNIDDTSCYNESYVPVDIHDLTFNLSSGERCILTSSDGKATSEVVIPPGIPDGCSYSTSLDDFSSYYISEPNTYYVEETANPYVAPTLNSPSFSIEGGWFSDNIEVALSAIEGDIYYTTDGTEPDENSTKYEGPITVYNKTEEPNLYTNLDNTTRSDNSYLPTYNVDKGTVIKAIAISDNGYSKVSSQTFFIGLNEDDYAGLPIISLTVDPEDFWSYEKGIYVTGKALDLFGYKMDGSKFDWSIIYDIPNYSQEGRGWERDAYIEYFSPELRKVYAQNIGIRIHGGWSVAEPQKSFNIYARKEYDNNEYLKYNILGNQLFYSSLTLRSGGNEDMYLSKSRDVFNQSRFSDRSVGTQAFSPCNVFINGEYWGMYNIQERVSFDYIKQHYGVDESNVILVKNGESKTDFPEDYAYYQEMVDYVSSHDLSEEKNYRQVEDLIDIQSCIDYYCAEIITANGDSYLNNWAAWRSKAAGLSPYEDCKWRWLLCDLDASDGISSESNSSDKDSFVFAGDVSPLYGDQLFPHLIANEEFKQRFVTSFIDILGYNFDYDTLSKDLTSLRDKIRTANIHSQWRFRGDYTFGSTYPGMEEFTAPYDDADHDHDFQVIDDFFKDREMYLRQYLLADFDLPGAYQDLTIEYKGNGSIDLSVNTTTIKDFSGTYNNEIYDGYDVTLKCQVPKGMHFDGWYIDGELLSNDTIITVSPWDLIGTVEIWTE